MDLVAFLWRWAGILPGSDVPEINGQNSVKRPAIERQ
jgi:hypothetical protein